MTLSGTAVLFLFAATAIAALVVLGREIAQGPPAAIDRAVEHRLFAKNVRAATFFTRCGYSPGILAAFVVAAAAAMLWSPARIVALPALLAAQGLSQFACRSLKARFGRARPENWLHRQEINAAYPSGHASTAIVTYGGICLLFLPVAALPISRLSIAVLGIVFVAGIGWSRIALGAHYLSDVVAGYLVGFATLCMVVACARVFAPSLI